LVSCAFEREGAVTDCQDISWVCRKKWTINPPAYARFVWRIFHTASQSRCQIM